MSRTLEEIRFELEAAFLLDSDDKTGALAVLAVDFVGAAVAAFDDYGFDDPLLLIWGGLDLTGRNLPQPIAHALRAECERRLAHRLQAD